MEGEVADFCVISGGARTEALRMASQLAPVKKVAESCVSEQLCMTDEEGRSDRISVNSTHNTVESCLWLAQDAFGESGECA